MRVRPDPPPAEASLSTPPSRSRAPRLALVLGGGGLKGFAHVGVLQALERRGIVPDVYAGTSIGALIAAAHACGVSTDEMAERAERLRRRDLFRINHVGMALRRMRSPSLYLEEPLRALVASVVPRLRLRDLPVPVLVNTVDLERGTQLVWGLPGLADAWLDDAVYASCALPGFFPPGVVAGRVCIDGGTVDNLPVDFAASLGVDAVIAVDVGSSQQGAARSTPAVGFAAIFMSAATTMMSALQRDQLARHRSPPLLLVRPAIAQVDWFAFGHAGDLVTAGREAAEAALDTLDHALAARSGVFPRRRMRIAVDRARCVGCGLCVTLAPDVMALDAHRCAYAKRPEVRWSAADGDFVRQCPTNAIHARDADEAEAALAREMPGDALNAPLAMTPPSLPRPPANRGPRVKPRG